METTAQGEIMLPRYPVYVPSKSRNDTCFTAKFLDRDEVPFFLVVEPQEAAQYEKFLGRFGTMLVLPWSGNDETRQRFCAERGIENGGLIAVRNWIKEHSIEELGASRHWQLDDNIRWIYRRYKGKRLPCAAGVALRVVEDFTDRYENIAISGMNYSMFLPEGSKYPPFYLNNHVYSCSLVNNAIPHRWRLAYNDDTDICLQVLADGWCTVLVNAFAIFKIRTMKVKGGNTQDLYQGDGRLKMARSLERVWPGVVTTKRRYHRPQHVIKDSWRKFDQQLVPRPDVDWEALKRGKNEYGMRLVQVADQIKSPYIQGLMATHQREVETESQGEEA